MKIQEHGVGTHVKLFHKFKEDEFWETEIAPSIEVKAGDYVICEPIEVNGVTGILNNAALIAELTQVETGRVYRYEIKNNGCFRYKGKLYYALLSDVDAEPYNRRIEYRTSFSSMADIQVNAHSRVWECYVKDISPQGIGLNVKKSTGFHCVVGDKASVSFEYNDRIYKLSGEIVRCIDNAINDEFFTVGVRLEITKQNTSWLALVSLQQRLELRIKRGDRK